MDEFDDRQAADLPGTTVEALEAEIEDFEDDTWDISGFGETRHGQSLRRATIPQRSRR